MTFPEILDELGIPTSREGHHVTANWIGIDCTRCSPGSGKWKAGWTPGMRSASCWTCGRLPLAELLVESAGIGWDRAKKLLAGMDDEDVPARERTVGKLVIPPGVGPMMKVHRDYLRGRGFDPDVLVSLWNVQGIGLAAKLAWRLFIPITYLGMVVSWTTRAINDSGGRKYVNAGQHEESMRAKDLLFGEDFLRHAAVVCEGQLDAMRIGPGAVATMGVGFTRNQVLRISKRPLRVMIFDSEPAAQDREVKRIRKMFLGGTE